MITSYFKIIKISSNIIFIVYNSNDYSKHRKIIKISTNTIFIVDCKIIKVSKNPRERSESEEV